MITRMFFFWLVTFSMSASAASLVGRYPVCMSEDDLSEFLTNSARTIQEGRCAMVKGGSDVVVLSGMFTLKIRLYLPSGKSIIVYTPAENVKR